MRHLVSLIILAIVAAPAPALAASKRCIDWPRLMAQYITQQRSEGPIIVVKEFTNFTGNETDDWLKKAYRDFLADLLGTAESARTWTSDVAAYSTPNLKARYTVGGSFQHMKDRLRVFIEVKDGVSGKVLRIVKVDTPYPNNAEFFYQTAQAVKEVGNVLDITFTERDFGRYRDATHSTEVFEYFQKGQQELAHYDPSRWDVARIWFEQARKTDFHSWLSYQGIIDLLTFQGLRAKLLGQPYTLYYQQAELELGRMQKLGKRPPAVPRWGKAKARKKKREELTLTNRFLKGNADFQRGMAALEAGDAKSAAEYLRRATTEVPEDAVAWKKLAQALTRLGKVEEANTARAKASTINRCR